MERKSRRTRRFRKRVIIKFTILVVLIVFYYYQRITGVFSEIELFNNIVISSILAVFVWIIHDFLRYFIRNVALRRTIFRVLLLLFLVAVFFVFQNNFLAFGISLGVIAGVMTIVFQSALLSIVGWIYLLISSLFTDGDIIRIGDYKGKVIDIKQMHTKILEMAGENVKSDIVSGRIVTIPNSMFLSTAVVNYTKQFKFVWYDLNFQITYLSDFKFLIDGVQDLLKKYVKEIKEEFEEKFEDFRDNYDLDEEEVSMLYYNLSPKDSWIDFVVTVPVLLNGNSNVTSRLTSVILDFIKENPKKVGFPKGNER